MNALAALRLWLGMPEVVAIAMIMTALWIGLNPAAQAKEEEVRADLQRLRTLLIWLTLAGIVLIIFVAIRHHPSARPAIW